MSSNYENDLENEIQTNDAILFCSLICFIPWTKFFSITNEKQNINENFLNNENLNHFSTTKYSEIKFINNENNWSIFQSRRKNSMEMMDESFHSNDFNFNKNFIKRSPKILNKKNINKLNL